MPDEPSTAELQRLIERVDKNIQGLITGLIAQMQQYVLREVYLAEKAAFADRIKRLEDQAEAARTLAAEEASAAQERAQSESATSHQAVRVAKLSAFLAFLASVGAGLVSGWLSSKGGGH